MEGCCCLCRELLPSDRRRKKNLHGSSCTAAKSALTRLSTLPLEDIDALADPAAVLCSNCECTVNNIEHYQSKVDSLKKKVMDMLSLQHATRRKHTASPDPICGGPSQAKQPCMDSAAESVGLSTGSNPVSPVVKVRLIHTLASLYGFTVCIGSNPIQKWDQIYQYSHSFTQEVCGPTC